MLLLEVPPLNPPVGESIGWAIVGACAVLVAIASVVLVWVLQKRQSQISESTSEIELCREKELAALDQIVEHMTNGSLTPAEAVQYASQSVRRFLGTVWDVDTDYMTLTEISSLSQRIPFAKPLAEFVEQTYPLVFANEVPEDATKLINHAKEMILRWQ